MKVRQLEDRFAELFAPSAFDVETEYTTDDGTRVDLAVHRAGEPLLAVEFEQSYKWMRSRILYDAVKADREGFPHLAIVYQFDHSGLNSGWVWSFIGSDLDVAVMLVHPDEVDKLPAVVEG